MALSAAQRRLVQSNGVAWERMPGDQAKAHWWRRDGTYVGLLPADAWSSARYQRRGFVIGPAPAPEKRS